MSRRYTLIAFDFDGTLVDTIHDIAYHANNVLKRFGYNEAPLGEVRKGIGLGVHELLRFIEPSIGADAEKLETAVEAFKGAYRDRPVLYTKAYPNVKNVLEGVLGASLKVIVTNKPQDITLQILDALGLSKNFNAVIGMNAGYPAKPDPSSLNYLIEKFQVSKKQTVFVGDSRVDAQTCAAAGVDFAFMNYGYDILENCRPNYEFSDAAEWGKFVS